MNRHDRRKLSRDATTEEIFPGETHAPIQTVVRENMLAVMDVLKKAFPKHDVTLFIAERDVPAGEKRLPRFNYASTAERADMLAVLRAFIAKHEASAAKVDKIADEPPTASRQ